MSSAVRSRRTGNVDADIDESLFATRKVKTPARATSAGGSLRSNGSAIVSQKMLHSITMNPAAGNTKESVVITGRDLHNMLALTGHLSGTGGATQGGFASTARSALNSTSSAAQARKDKMLRLEREIASRPAQLSQSEFEEKESRRILLGHARQAMDEEMDDVRAMNQMIAYAQVATIRDAQILEKSRMADELLAEEKRIDHAMEIERVRTLKLQHERQQARAIEQRLGARVIETQIAERENERVRQQEAREQEAAAMLARVAAIEAREEQDRLDRIAAGRQLLAQVTLANHAQARQKLARKAEEVEEEARIQDYIRSKEAREAATEAELARVRDEKEKEVARLRAMQERAQDRQSAIDELRAKRYQEAKDRQWRQGQLEAAEKKEGMKRDIGFAREAQHQEKSRRIAEQALQEREEYMRVLEWQTAQAGIDRAKAEAAAASAAQHRSDIQNQMALKEREKLEARARYLGEGSHYAAQHARDKEKLEKMKAEKLAMMEQMGIPTKYRAELARKKMLESKFRQR